MTTTATASTVVSQSLLEAVADISIDLGQMCAHIDGDMVEASTHRSLGHALAARMYHTWHSGQGETDGQKARSLRDPDFEAELVKATPHTSTRVSAPVVHPGSDAHGPVVVLDGVQVEVPAESVLSTEAPERGQQIEVRTPAVRAALSPGFFLVDGGAGRDRTTPVLRVYLHLDDADAAPVVWHTVLAALEEEKIGYRAKISSATALYPRTDGMVVYLGQGSWHAAELVARQAEGMNGVARGGSLFTRQLRPGISVAWEVTDARAQAHGLSFGQHRARAVSEALIAHALEPDEPVEDVLHRFLDQARIDPGDLSRNSDSPQTHETSGPTTRGETS